MIDIANIECDIPKISENSRISPILQVSESISHCERDERVTSFERILKGVLI